MARRTGGRLRAALFLLISAVAGLFAAGVVGLTLWSLERSLQQATHRPRAAVVQIPVVHHTLERGQAVTYDDLKMVDILIDYLPEGVARTSDEVVGRVPRERLLALEPLRLERLAPAGETESLSVLVPAGMRAVSVVLHGHDRVSGFLESGNRVDIIVHTDASDGGDSETRTVLWGVQVLALSRTQHDGGHGKPQVVLLLTPDDAQTLTHAVEAGQVKLVLRSDIDLTLSDTERESVTTRSLLGLPEQRLAVRAWMTQRVAEPHLLTIIHGPDRHVEAFTVETVDAVDAVEAATPTEGVRSTP